MKKIIIFLLLFILTACNDKSTSKRDISIENNLSENNITVEERTPQHEATATPHIQSKTIGKFIDSMVIGLNYSCDGVNALTNKQGEFSCKKAPIVFKIGKLILGSIDNFTTDNVVYPQDILGLERSDFTSTNLIKLTRFIQSLDDGDISVSIDIPSSLASKFTKEQTLSDLSLGQLESLLGKRLVDESTAIGHLKESMGVSVDEVEPTINNNAIAYTTEAEFNQTEYAKNHLSDEESRKIIRMHNLVATAIDPEPEWFMTRVDKMISVVQAGDDYVVHLNKVGKDNKIISPVDNEKLRLVVKIQRGKDDFEYVTNNNISQYAQWTDKGELSIHIPDDLEYGRLLVGVRPNFDDVGVTAIAERWSTMIIGEVWKIKDEVKVLEKDDVLFPVVGEVKLLDSKSKFNSEEIAYKLKKQIKSENPFMFPLVLINLDVKKGDLLAYELNGKPYSGRVFSIEKKDTQQFVFLTPEFFEVYNIMDGEEGFLRKEGLYPEHMTFREGNRIVSDINESDPIRFSKQTHRSYKPSFLNFFKKSCTKGEASLVFSPSFSLNPFSASLQTSVKMGTPKVSCSWIVDDKNPNTPRVSIDDYIPPFSPLSVVLIVLGAKTEILPIGGLTFGATLGQGMGVSVGVHSNKKTDFKFLGTDDSIFRIGSHNLTHKTSYQTFVLGLSGGAQVNFKILSYTEYKELYNENILNPKGAVFNEEELSFLPSLDISMSSSLEGSIKLNVANASSIYKDNKNSEIVLSVDSILTLKYAKDIANLLKFFTSLKLAVQSKIITPIFKVEFPLTYVFDSVKDDGQGSAQIIGLRPNVHPVFASLFSEPKGVIADKNKKSSIFNDEVSNISYDVKDCKNAYIESDVIACSSWICGKVDKKVKLCQSITSTPINELAKVNETVRGTITVKNHGERTHVAINDDFFNIKESGIILLEKEEERKLNFSQTCPSEDGIYRGETRISNLSNTDLFTIGSLLVCEKGDDTNSSCPEGEECPPPPPPPCPNPPCGGGGGFGGGGGGGGGGNSSSPDDRLVGDPHIITSDGLGYNFFASGDYVLSRVEEMQDEYEIQGRFLPGFETSWPQAVAIKVGNDIVEVQGIVTDGHGDGSGARINALAIWVNGKKGYLGSYSLGGNFYSIDSIKKNSVQLPSGGAILVGKTTSSTVLKFPSSIIIIWPKNSKAESIGVKLNVAFNGEPFIDVDILKPSSTFAGQQRGLLGNDDGNPKNDFVRRNGQVLGEDHNLSFTELYGLFGTDWLVRPYESLFRNPEAIKPEFPSSPVTLTPEQRALGEEACIGLIGFYYESCVLDVGLTGSTTLVEEYYSNTEDLNSFSEQIVEPDVNRAFYTMDMLRKEKFLDSNLTHAHYKQKISIEKKSGEGKFILLVRPPKGATASLETGRGSYVGEGEFNTSVTVNCQELNETTNRDIYLKDGAVQLWSQDELSGTIGHLYKSVKLSCSSELEGLIAHWSFDDCTAKDNSGHGIDGEIHGDNMHCVDGIHGKALKFDGATDYVSMNLPIDGTKDWSVCTWFNLEYGTTGSEYQTFISNDDFALDFHSSNLDYSVWAKKILLNLGKVEENRDTFICYSKRNNKLNLYVDAQKIGETNNGLEVKFSKLTQIGGWKRREMFKGILDEMKVYNRSLDKEDIEFLYRLGGRRTFVELGQDRTFIDGENVYISIDDSTDNIIKYEWREGDTVLGIESNITLNSLSRGRHTITLIATDINGNIVEDSIEIYLKPLFNAGSDKNITLDIGFSVQNATTNYQGGRVIYYSSDYTIASMKSSQVILHKVGQVTIKAILYDKNGYKLEEDSYLLTISLGNMTIDAGADINLTNNIKTFTRKGNSSVRDSNKTYSSSNENIALVDDKGVVHLTGNLGSTEITIHATHENYLDTYDSYIIGVKLALFSTIDSRNSLLLNWKKVPDAESYTLFYAKESFSSIDDLSDYLTLNGGMKIEDIADSNKTIDNLEKNVKYYFVLTSMVNGVESTSSDENIVIIPISNKEFYIFSGKGKDDNTLFPWVSDGSLLGTKKISVENNREVNVDNVTRYISFLDSYYYLARDENYKKTLWKTDKLGLITNEAVSREFSSLLFSTKKYLFPLILHSYPTPSDMFTLNSNGVVSPIGQVINENHAVFDDTLLTTKIIFSALSEDRSIHHTYLFKDNNITLIENINNPYWLTNSNNQLFYFTKQDSNVTLWKATNQGLSPLSLVSYNFGSYTNYSKLYKFLPSNKVKSLNLYNDKNQMITMKNRLYFNAFDINSDNSLWVSDGTKIGTKLIKDIDSNRDSEAEIVGMSGIDENRFIFLVCFNYNKSQQNNDAEGLWISDGSTDGTKQLKSISLNSIYNYLNKAPKVLNGKYYFVSEENSLWVSDGTEIGTKIVKEFTESIIQSLDVKNGLLFFEVEDESKYKLWRSDGTEEGTFSLDVVSKEYHEI